MKHVQHSIVALAAALMVAATWVGCASSPEAQPQALQGRVVAELDGQGITADELLAELESSQYDLVKRSLDVLVSKRLVEEEAAARGVTTDELIRAEVSSVISFPDQEEIDQFYEANKAAMGSRPLEEARPRISQMLQRRKFAARRDEFISELKKRAGYRRLLDPPRTAVEIPAGTPVKGPDTAPVTIIEFADFECPSCRRAFPWVERVLNEYGDRIRFAFRDFPLPRHPRAIPMSVAARCANEQDRFWDFHQNLMLMQGNFDDNDLRKRAQQLSLNVDDFSACLESGRHRPEIEASFNEGLNLGVSSTPTFFVNGRRVVGLPGYDEFKEIIEEELGRAGA